VERMADEDTSNGMLSANVAQAAKVVFSIRAGQSCVRLRGEAQLIGKGEPKALAAVVDSENALWIGYASWLVSWHARFLNWLLVGGGMGAACRTRPRQPPRGNRPLHIIIRDATIRVMGVVGRMELARAQRLEPQMNADRAKNLKTGRQERPTADIRQGRPGRPGETSGQRIRTLRSSSAILPGWPQDNGCVDEGGKWQLRQRGLQVRCARRGRGVGCARRNVLPEIPGPSSKNSSSRRRFA